MSWVVFLRAVNVGGANLCRPAQLAKQLSKFGVVNIGAVGTFVVRENVSESTLRNAFAKKLPFKCEIMICSARDIMKLASKDPFSKQPSGANITRFVNVLSKRLPSPPPLPLCLPSDDEWLLKMITIRGEPHTVLQAIDRSLTHASYHTGQILYIARLVKKGNWRYITVPPGQSEQFKAAGGKYLK